MKCRLQLDTQRRLSVYPEPEEAVDVLVVHSAVSTVKLTGKRQMGSRAYYSRVDPLYEDGKCAKTPKLLHALGSDASKGAHLIKGHRLQGVCSSKAVGFAASARGIIGQGSQKDSETLTQLRCGLHGHLYRDKNSPGALWDSKDPPPPPCQGLSDPNRDISPSAQAGAISWMDHVSQKRVPIQKSSNVGPWREVAAR